MTTAATVTTTMTKDKPNDHVLTFCLLGPSPKLPAHDGSSGVVVVVVMMIEVVVAAVATALAAKVASVVAHAAVA